MLLADVHGAGRAALLVAMRRVDHHRQVEFLGELQLRAEIFVLQRRLLVIADLADRHDALLQREARQDLHDAFRQLLVVGFLRVQADRAVMADAELAGAKALEADDVGEVVDIGADIGARLAEPEGRLDQRHDAGGGHRLVIVGGARDHVGVRIDEHHGGSLRSDVISWQLHRAAGHAERLSQESAPAFTAPPRRAGERAARGATVGAGGERQRGGAPLLPSPLPASFSRSSIMPPSATGRCSARAPASPAAPPPSARARSRQRSRRASDWRARRAPGSARASSR